MWQQKTTVLQQVSGVFDQSGDLSGWGWSAGVKGTPTRQGSAKYPIKLVEQWATALTTYFDSIA